MQQAVEYPDCRLTSQQSNSNSSIHTEQCQAVSNPVPACHAPTTAPVQSSGRPAPFDMLRLQQQQPPLQQQPTQNQPPSAAEDPLTATQQQAPGARLQQKLLAASKPQQQQQQQQQQHQQNRVLNLQDLQQAMQTIQHNARKMQVAYLSAAQQKQVAMVEARGIAQGLIKQSQQRTNAQRVAQADKTAAALMQKAELAASASASAASADEACCRSSCNCTAAADCSAQQGSPSIGYCCGSSNIAGHMDAMHCKLTAGSRAAEQGSAAGTDTALSTDQLLLMALELAAADIAEAEHQEPAQVAAALDILFATAMQSGIPGTADVKISPDVEHSTAAAATRASPCRPGSTAVTTQHQQMQSPAKPGNTVGIETHEYLQSVGCAQSTAQHASYAHLCADTGVDASKTHNSRCQQQQLQQQELQQQKPVKDTDSSGSMYHAAAAAQGAADSGDGSVTVELQPHRFKNALQRDKLSEIPILASHAAAANKQHHQLSVTASDQAAVCTPSTVRSHVDAVLGLQDCCAASDGGLLWQRSHAGAGGAAAAAAAVTRAATPDIMSLRPDISCLQVDQKQQLPAPDHSCQQLACDKPPPPSRHSHSKQQCPGKPLPAAHRPQDLLQRYICDQQQEQQRVAWLLQQQQLGVNTYAKHHLSSEAASSKSSSLGVKDRLPAGFTPRWAKISESQGVSTTANQKDTPSMASAPPLPPAQAPEPCGVAASSIQAATVASGTIGGTAGSVPHAAVALEADSTAGSSSSSTTSVSGGVDVRPGVGRQLRRLNAVKYSRC